MADAGAAAAAGARWPISVTAPAALTADPRERAALWSIRKGLYTAVAGARPSGTTALLEDVVVPVPALLGTCESLLELFERHAYRDSVIFGHAKDGNIHFMLNERSRIRPTSSATSGSPRTWSTSSWATAAR